MRRFLLGIFCPCLGFGALSAGPANAQTTNPGFCGEAYVIQSGDSMSSLAVRAFGSPNAYTEFYNDPRNVAALGTNPDVIIAGSVLQLPPCGNGSAVDPANIKQAPTAAIEVVTGGHYAPFTDLSAPGRGMLTEVVSAAIDASGMDRDHRIDFINDWSSHLNLLLPLQKYDFAFPWFRPDCTDPQSLPEADQIRCQMAWSEPLYSIEIAIYGFGEDGELPGSFDELTGKRLCRPAGYFIFDLANAGLTEDKIELVRPDTPDACFTALERGETDYVTLNRFTAEKAIARGGFAGLVEAIPNLVTTQELHLVAHQNDEQAATNWLDGFNAGLRAISGSGELNRIVSRHIERHNQEVAKLSDAMPN